MSKRITSDQLRSRHWFRDMSEPGATALHVERYTNFGLSAAELRSGRPMRASGSNRSPSPSPSPRCSPMVMATAQPTSSDSRGPALTSSWTCRSHHATTTRVRRGAASLRDWLPPPSRRSHREWATGTAEGARTCGSSPMTTAYSGSRSAGRSAGSQRRPRRRPVSGHIRPPRPVTAASPRRLPVTGDYP